jgi:hypothetical protein
MLLVMFSGISHRSRPGKYLVLLARLDPESFTPFLENRW